VNSKVSFGGLSVVLSLIFPLRMDFSCCFVIAPLGLVIAPLGVVIAPLGFVIAPLSFTVFPLAVALMGLARSVRDVAPTCYG